MLSFFRPVDAADHRKQVDRTAEILAETLAATVPKPAEEKRPIGRPKKVRSADEVLHAVADMNGIIADTGPVAKKARGDYTRWFDSPYINDIMSAWTRCRFSARSTVKYLKQHAPDDRFEKLSHSTVASWFEQDGTLKPAYRRQLYEGRAVTTGRGPCPVLQQVEGLEDAIVDHLLQLRAGGAPVGIPMIRWVMAAILLERHPDALNQLKLSSAYISRFVRRHPKLEFTWRLKTTAASKLPLDWEAQGVQMAMRVAAAIELHKIHISLVFNMDQTGVHLMPSSTHTYDRMGNKSVPVLGADDKRQITACVGASLRGELLPLQLIFQGTTPRCLPPETAASKSSRVHLTFSENHWSSLQTMKEYIIHVLSPHADRMIALHQLPSDAHMLLILDCWSVHRSEAFLGWLKQEHPRIHVVFVPPNCTSKLQLADVALQRSFKAVLKDNFNSWAGEQILDQIRRKELVGLKEFTGMKSLKSLVLKWSLDSWGALRERRTLILDGWQRCLVSLFDVHNPEKRLEAVAQVALDKLALEKRFDEEEPAPSEEAEAEWGAESEDSEADELDLLKPRLYGKKSERKSVPPKPFGYVLNSDRMQMDTDDEE